MGGRLRKDVNFMHILEKQFYMPKKNLGAAVKRQPKVP